MEKKCNANPRRSLSLFGIKTPKRGKEAGSYDELLRIFIFIIKLLIFIRCRIFHSWTGAGPCGISRPRRTKRGGIFTKPISVLRFPGGFRQLIRASRIGEAHLFHDQELIPVVGFLFAVLLVALILEVTKEAIHPLKDFLQPMLLLFWHIISRGSRSRPRLRGGGGATRTLAAGLSGLLHLARSSSPFGRW